MTTGVLAATRRTPEGTDMKGACAQQCPHLDSVPFSCSLPSIRHLGSEHDLLDSSDLFIGELNSPRFAPGRLFSVIPGRLSFSAHRNEEHTMKEIQRNPQLFFFSTDLQERYVPFCSDFGPVNLATVVQFCDYVRDKETDERLTDRHLVYYCGEDVESLSNTAFLIGAYLVLEHGFTPEKAVAPFKEVSGIPIMPFRDPTFVESTFPLSVLDCLRGLKKAVAMKWFDLEDFNLDQYEWFDSPENGDMHQICPKFVAFRGPEQPCNKQPRGNKQPQGSGSCSPKLVIEMFKVLGVAKVIRLNNPDGYNRKVFLKAGVGHADLHFEDCTCPSDELVAKFLEMCEEEKGVVAVHCLAGLGRTGTLIGLWLMSKCGFTAREAIAWMRIVRPGSVIGQQQHYLVWMEGRLKDGSFPWTISHIKPSQRFNAVPSSVSDKLASQVRNAITTHRREPFARSFKLENSKSTGK